MATETDQDQYIQMDDISHISRALDWEKICLHPKDKISIQMWLNILRLEGANAFCKDKIDHTPQGSGLSEDLFCLVLQTRFQSEMFQELRNALICICYEWTPISSSLLLTGTYPSCDTYLPCDLM